MAREIGTGRINIRMCFSGSTSPILTILFLSSRPGIVLCVNVNEFAMRVGWGEGWGGGYPENDDLA